MSDPSLPQVSDSSRNLYRLSIFIGAGTLIYACCVDIPRAFENWHWPRTVGTVTRSRTVTEDVGDAMGGQRTIARIDFTYEVAGQQYKGRWQPREELAMWGLPQNIVLDHPRGTPLAVYYSPQDPARYVMDPGITLGTLMSSLIGISLLTFGLYQERKHKIPWTWKK